MSSTIPGPVFLLSSALAVCGLAGAADRFGSKTDLGEYSITFIDSRNYTFQAQAVSGGQVHDFRANGVVRNQLYSLKRHGELSSCYLLSARGLKHTIDASEDPKVVGLKPCLS